MATFYPQSPSSFGDKSSEPKDTPGHAGRRTDMNFIKKTAARLIENLLEEKAQEDLGEVSIVPALVAFAIPLLIAGVPAGVEFMQKKARRQQQETARLTRMETLLGPQLEALEEEAKEKERYDEARELLSKLSTAKFVVDSYEKKQERKESSAA
jgi:hypothetical protein